MSVEQCDDIAVMHAQEEQSERREHGYGADGCDTQSPV